MRRLAILAAAACLPAFAASAAQQEPEWPCVQRKVPELSLAQIWTGLELPPGAQQWKEDETVAGLVAELAQRRMPLDEAERRIKDFARSLPERERDERTAKLVEGLFDTMNRERSEVISAIGRYARKQLELAALIRERASELAATQQGNTAASARRNEELALTTRIYTERMQNLTYVCEVPTLIEQRLYALARFIAPMTSKDAGP